MFIKKKEEEEFQENGATLYKQVTTRCDYWGNFTTAIVLHLVARIWRYWRYYCNSIAIVFKT